MKTWMTGQATCGQGSHLIGETSLSTNEYSFYLYPSKIEGIGVFASHDIPLAPGPTLPR